MSSFGDWLGDRTGIHSGKDYLQTNASGLQFLGGMVYNGMPLDGGEQARTDARLNREAANDLNEKNERLQREFAQHGLRWKVEDAKAAGLHPLYALGGQGATFSPLTAIADQGTPSPTLDLAGLSQNITGAMARTSTGQEKQMQQLQLQSMQLDVEGKTIDNQMRATQLRQLQTGPNFPGSDNFIPGQGNSGMKINPAERTQSAPGRPAQEKGWVPDVGYARTDTGLTPVPSKDVKERIEDQLVPESMWAARNYILPNIGKGEKPPKSMLPKGYNDWYWDPSRQEFRPTRTGMEQFKHLTRKRR